MKIKKSLFLLFFAFALCFIPIKNVFAGASLSISISDNSGKQLIGVYDLRDRETFIQVTNTDIGPSNQTIHIQIYNVNENCNENNFFDVYTPNDTHVYNLRNILTNDGNPSGVVLPDNAYGIITAVISPNSGAPLSLIANMRIIDDNGYEYRTNFVDTGVGNPQSQGDDKLTFNFNTAGGVTLSDVFGLELDGTDSSSGEILVSDVLNVWISFDIDIYDLNETPFSCRNVIFACLDQEHPLYEELLDESGDASVASFEYGINNAIPHSKGGELLCPGNVISEGFVLLDYIDMGDDADAEFILFVGLNNGNGRGSFDSHWYEDKATNQGNQM